MADKTAKKTTARKPRAKKADAATTEAPAASSFRSEPLPPRTGTHTRDYDPK